MATLVGQLVELPVPCPCGVEIGVVAEGQGPHAASVRCSGCRRHLIWLSKKTYDWIARVTEMFGAPAAIRLRRNQLPLIEVSE